LTERQSRQLKKAFIESFRMHGNVTTAARLVGIHRTVIYSWQEKDEAFLQEFRQAEIEATETMEAEAYRRAVKGTAEPVFHQGAAVGTVQKYSDTLLIFMLKARNPGKYRDNNNTGQSGDTLVKGYPAEMLDKLA
jgi:hypothetical protein